MQSTALENRMTQMDAELDYHMGVHAAKKNAQ
jgi:hypothetical protein